MPVNTPHAQFMSRSAQWERVRDALAGQDRVRSKALTYLRKPAAMDLESFNSYARAATWFPATARTLAGLTGAIFRRPPMIQVPDSDLLGDVDRLGTPFDVLAKRVVEEVIAVGRHGVLVDAPSAEIESGSPYLATFPAESIVNWRTANVGGGPKLTLVVLRDDTTRPKEEDRFAVAAIERYRVLELSNVDGRRDPVYTISLFERRNTPHMGEDLTLVEGPIIALRRGEPLTFIPFQFFGPTTLEPAIEMPPLLGLADLNFSHFRTTGEYENSLWHCGFPIFAISGQLSGPEAEGATELRAGSSVIWQLEQGAKAEVLQGSADNVGALKEALERKEQALAAIGARMLEPQQSGNPEHHSTVALRHRGEDAILSVIASTSGRGFTRVLDVLTWWSGQADEPTGATSVELNSDFMPQGMTGAEVVRWVSAWQANGIGLSVLHHNLKKGEALPEGMELDDLAADIENRGPQAAFMGDLTDEEE